MMLDIKGLARQLPRESLRAVTRERLEAALAGAVAGPEALADVRQAVVELLADGALVKVALAGGGRAHALYLVRGTSHLLDLSGLVPAGSPTAAIAAAEPAFDGSLPPDGGAEPTAGAAIGTLRVDHLAGVLDAMERAQDLDVGDPRSHETDVQVDRILDLLHRFVPSLLLRAQLHGLTPSEGTRWLLPPPQSEGMPFWLRHRRFGQALWIPDASELPADLRQAAEERGEAVGVTAVVPLLGPQDRRQEVGLLYVTAPAEWASDRLLSLAGRLATFVSRRWQCQRDVNRRVLTDSLTGIQNRAFFDSQFSLELERASRAGLPLTLVIGDLDRFKDVNDAHGHQCGDVVLQTVARRLHAALRRIDHVCRIGGEEFGCLLPSTSRDEAREVLSRIVGQPYRVDLPPELGVGGLTVTMSYGAVTFPDAGNSPSELHRKADSMLYLAKKLGRNLCCIWMPDGRHQLIRALPPGSSALR